MEFGGLVIEVLIIFGIPILIPILIILCAGKLSYNEKINPIICIALNVIIFASSFISSIIGMRGNVDL